MFSQSAPDELCLKEIGSRLKQIRLGRNLKQESVASEAGISVPTLSNLENGTKPVQLNTFIRVLRVLGLMEGLNALLPPADLTPQEALAIEKKKTKGRRKRASSLKKQVRGVAAGTIKEKSVKNPGFKWGKDQKVKS